LPGAIQEQELVFEESDSTTMERIHLVALAMRQSLCWIIFEQAIIDPQSSNPLHPMNREIEFDELGTPEDGVISDSFSR
jgi:hypothetical protein